MDAERFPILFTCMHTIFSDCTVAEFLKYMKQLDCSGDRLYLPDLKYRDSLYVWELRGLSMEAQCADIPCCFFGGPPTCLQWWEGTLAMLLIDRFFTSVLVKNEVKALAAIQDSVAFLT